jgi:hypothetical protein
MTTISPIMPDRATRWLLRGMILTLSLLIIAQWVEVHLWALRGT